ncbi:MAG: D-cysteine desulfhydrase family protein [Anaerolineales bacterium]
MLETLRRLPRIRLGHLPTPVEPLPRLGAQLGVQIWVKRDDLTGLGMGGNKVRKLEWLVAEALAHGAKTLLTLGAVQSNHCRQTAAAAARIGLDCVLVLGGDSPAHATGNVLLDKLLGAELIWAGTRNREEVLAETFDQLWSAGRRPHQIPYGGSSPVGAAAFANALAEFLDQGIEVDRIVHATSSGGTQAGLLAGAVVLGFRGEILGISVDRPASELAATVHRLSGEILALGGGTAHVSPDSVHVLDEYCRPGYAVVSDLERGAIREFARSEGLLLDPVYTGRAAGGLLDLVRSGRIERGERILFWHTGGGPALFAHGDEL